MDPNNPIVQLCAQGMMAEGEGRPEDAKALFMEAWEKAANDYEAAMAAHYVARHQPDLQEALHWNRMAVERAEISQDEEINDFYPSLYLNLAHSYEHLADFAEARRYYDRAAAAVESLPAGPYTDLVRRGIQGGQERVSGGEEGLPGQR